MPGREPVNPERIARIIPEIIEGNYPLFEEIVATFQDRLTHFIYRVVKDEDDAVDLCQDTFFKAYTSLKSFRFKCKFSTWLFQIGYHLSLNFVKKKKRRVELDERVLLPDPRPAAEHFPDLETEELCS
ncbi:MAG: RNA polymerase sigma factor, partial [bacterium]|nr:RNA polymerase sigma factor [bacterium]